MILCVGLSPALDVTYRVPNLVPGRTTRVASVETRPGGKAVNVGRVLAALGEPAHVVVPVGGSSGAELEQRLADTGVLATYVPDRVDTRRTVTTVADDGTATVLTEPAGTDAWPEVRRAVAELLPRARVLVLSGAVPTGAPPDALADLVSLAFAHGVPSVVDTSGAPLRAVLAGRPTLVKPNADELAELGHDGDPVAAAQALASTYDVGVVASLGRDGLTAAAAGHTWTARPAEVVDGNPTGAGDALVAGLARFLAGRGGGPLHDLGDALPDGVALAAAAVHRPCAGEVDLAAHRAYLPRVVVREGASR